MLKRLLITATAPSDDMFDKLERAGADRVVSPFHVAARFILLSSTRPDISDFINAIIFNYMTGLETTELYMETTSPWIGQTVGSLNLQDQFQAGIIGIRLADKQNFVYAPTHDYVIEQNQVNAGERPGVTHGVTGKRVVILGGGDTGSDCLGTALRQGATEVTQIELVPAPPIGRNPATPWPAWPIVFRTSSSQEEGGERSFGFRTTRLEGEANKLVAHHGISVARAQGELVDVPGTELRIPCDALILALGFTGPSSQTLVDQLGVRLDPRGNVAVDAELSTNVARVFCAGDAQRGASLVVWAIAEGRRVARSVHRALGPRTPA